MADTHPTGIEDLDASAHGGASEALAVLAAALRGRTIPNRDVRSTGRQASPAEGLALLESFTRIEDPRLRQALLDATAALLGGVSH